MSLLLCVSTLVFSKQECVENGCAYVEREERVPMMADLVSRLVFREKSRLTCYCATVSAEKKWKPTPQGQSIIDNARAEQCMSAEANNKVFLIDSDNAMFLCSRNQQLFEATVQKMIEGHREAVLHMGMKLLRNEVVLYPAGQDHLFIAAEFHELHDENIFSKKQALNFGLAIKNLAESGQTGIFYIDGRRVQITFALNGSMVDLAHVTPGAVSVDNQNVDDNNNEK